MSRASRARRIAAAAAVGGTGLTLLGATGVGVLVAEVHLARRWIGKPFAQAPDADGVYGAARGRRGVPLVLGVVGDSSAAGLGTELPEQTPGAVLAAGLAIASGRPVHLRSVAVSGAESSTLGDQVERLLADVTPDIVVIMIGGNDVTHRVKPAVAVRALGAVVTRLREAGSEVVVGTCPDLGTIEPVAQPLRWIARRLSRELAAAQTVAVVDRGGCSVSLADLLGPEFRTRPTEMFSSDKFHPSAIGYARVASVLLPAVCAALGYWSDGDREPTPDGALGEVVGPLPAAAAVAAEDGGTEVSPVRLAGAGVDPRGRWAMVRRRRRGAPAAESLAGASPGPGGLSNRVADLSAEQIDLTA